MEKQVFLEFGLRFNLRQTKQERPTILYAVFVWHGVQYKVNTSLKVFPSHWDNKSQSATVSNRLSKRDNWNNRIVNKQIIYLNELVLEKKNYLCNELEADIVKEIKYVINPHITKKMMKSKNKQMSAFLMDMLYSKPTKAESKYNSAINSLKEYLQEATIDDDINNLNGDLLNDFQQFLVKQGKLITTIRNYVADIKTLINRSKDRSIKIDLSTLVILKDERSKEQKKSKNVPLTEEQLLDLYNLKGLTKKEEEARDLFICQSLLGQRISDMPKIFKGDYISHTEDGNEIISFNVQKTGEQATLYLFPLAKEIIEKYRTKSLDYYNLFETDEKKLKSTEGMINKTIKDVCKKAGLNSEIIFSEQIGDKIINKREPLYKLMHTHIARHTFITLMCKKGVPKDIVIIATAHTDTKMIDDVYLHETVIDKGRKFIEALQEKGGNSVLFAVPSSKTNQDLLNKVFAYDSFISIINLMESNNDVFHLDSTKQAIKVMKDISKLNSYPKDADVSKVAELEQVIFELSYYFRDTLLYSVFKHKEHCFGMEVDVPSTEEVEIMFAQEDLERPKRWQQIQLEEWENSHK